MMVDVDLGKGPKEGIVTHVEGDGKNKYKIRVRVSGNE